MPQVMYNSTDARASAPPPADDAGAAAPAQRGGFLGTLCIGIFADENVNEVKASGELFGKQFAAAVGTAAYAYAVGFALVKVIEKFMKIIPPQHALELGLDASIHGERAYKDTSQNGGKTAV